MRRSASQPEPVQPFLNVRRTPFALPTKAFAKDLPLSAREPRWTGRTQALHARLDGGEPGERVLSRQQDVGNACKCKEVIPRIGMLTFEQLAAGVARSGDGSTLRPTGIPQQFVRGAEVQHPQLTVIGDEDILRVDVAVHDAARVGMGKSGANVAHHGQRDRPRQGNRVSCAYDLTEKRTDQRLHREEGVVAVAVEFMHSNDVRMGQQLQVLEFALQLGEKFVSLGNRRMENFDRYPLPGAGPIDAILVDGVEHGAHAAVPEYSPYPIAATQHVADRHFPSDFSQCPA